MQGEFRIDDWLVQPRLNTVEREGMTRHLEPRVMQVLVQLAMHPNEVLSKDRLLETVWHGTFVGDDVLIRCISEIRYAFGDEPKSSRVIQTIPKSGYRLIAKVTRDAPASADASVSDQDKPGPAGLVHQQVSEFPEVSALHSIEESRTEKERQGSLAAEAHVPAHSQPRSPDQSSDTFQSVLFADRVESSPHTRLPRVLSRHRWSSIAAAASIVILIAFLGFGLLSRITRRTAPDSFWEPILRETGPVLICVADHPRDSAIVLYDASNPDLSVQMKVDAVSIAMTDLNTSMKVVGIVQSGKKPYILRPQAETSLSDLRTGSAVFIGGFDNAWTLRVTNQLRFHFSNTPDMDLLRVVDSSNPGESRWMRGRRMPSAINNHRDYAIVARFTDSSTGKPAVVIAGVGSAGTIAAGDFLSDTASLDRLMRDAVAAGDKKNVEAVLSVQVVNGEPGTPTVEAVHFW